MGLQQSGSVRINEALNWLTRYRPNTLSALSQEYEAIINSAYDLGEEQETHVVLEGHRASDGESESKKRQLLCHKGKFMLATIKDMEPLIFSALDISVKRAARARNWSFVAWFSTTVFSVTTLTALNVSQWIDAAQWTAAGTTFSAFGNFVTEHFNRVTDGDKKIGIGEARDLLIDLRYDIKECRNELELRVAYPEDEVGLAECISRGNALCRQGNQYAALVRGFDEHERS